MMVLALQLKENSVPFPAVAFPPSHSNDSLNIMAQLPSVFVPFLLPAGSALITLVFPRCVILPPADFLSLIHVFITRPLQASHCPDPSSLCAPRGKWSDPVSAYSILQESCYLLAVILQRNNTFKTRDEILYNSGIHFYWIMIWTKEEKLFVYLVDEGVMN